MENQCESLWFTVIHVVNTKIKTIIQERRLIPISIKKKIRSFSVHVRGKNER